MAREEAYRWLLAMVSKGAFIFTDSKPLNTSASRHRTEEALASVSCLLALQG